LGKNIHLNSHRGQDIKATIFVLELKGHVYDLFVKPEGMPEVRFMPDVYMLHPRRIPDALLDLNTGFLSSCLIHFDRPWAKSDISAYIASEEEGENKQRRSIEEAEKKEWSSNRLVSAICRTVCQLNVCWHILCQKSLKI
jgi:hypothetical protein